MIDSSARIGYLLFDVVDDDENNRLNKCRCVVVVLLLASPFGRGELFFPETFTTAAGTKDSTDRIDTATMIDFNNFISLFVCGCVVNLRGTWYLVQVEYVVVMLSQE